MIDQSDLKSKQSELLKIRASTADKQVMLTKMTTASDTNWASSRQEGVKMSASQGPFSPQFKAEINGLGVPLKANKTSRRKKDSFMDDLLGFRLNNPTAFSQKAFGTQYLPVPWQKKDELAMQTPQMLQSKKKLSTRNAQMSRPISQGQKTTLSSVQESDHALRNLASCTASFTSKQRPMSLTNEVKHANTPGEPALISDRYRIKK